MDSWIHGFMDSWIHGFMDSWIHGFMDSWIHGFMVFHGLMDFIQTIICYMLTKPYEILPQSLNGKTGREITETGLAVFLMLITFL